MEKTQTQLIQLSSESPSGKLNSTGGPLCRQKMKNLGSVHIQSVCVHRGTSTLAERSKAHPGADVTHQKGQRWCYSSSTSRSPSPTVSPGLQWTFLT